MDARRDSTPTMVEEVSEATEWDNYPSLPEYVASGEYSDFTIACDGQLYGLHQVIVCPQSRVIKAACSAMQGAASMTMHIGETDTFTIRYVINFLYVGDYKIDPDWVEEQLSLDGAEDVNKVENEKAVRTLLAHLRVNIFAYHHEIQDLIEYSGSNIKHVFQSVPAYRLPAFIQRLDSCTGNLPRHWVSACKIGGHIQERIQDLITAPDFSRLDVDKRILLETIRACGERIHFLEHTCEITREMYLRLARQLGDE